MKLRVIAAIHILTFICATLQGCVSLSSTPYPKDWPKIAMTRCEAVEGRYGNTSEMVPEQRSVEDLFYLVGLSGWTNRPNEQIVIQFPESGRLEVRGTVDSRTLLQEKGEFRCEDGKIEIHHSNAHIEKEGWGPGRIAQTSTIAKASDGTLIVNREESVLALVAWILPIYQKTSRWYRFKNVEEPVSGEHTDGMVSVFLIPLDDFPVDYVAQLAQELSRVLHIYVKPTVVMGTRGLQPFPATDQYCAEDIVESAAPVVERLPEKRKDSAFILITRRDINEKARNFRFLFAWHQKEKRISVISTARMLARDNISRADDKIIFERILKMTKRAIGEQYYGLQRSADIRDVMYSPIMSLEDIDKMGLDFTGLKK